MRASIAMIVLIHVCMGMALEASAGTEGCGTCECSCPPNKKNPGKKINPPKPPSSKPPSKPSPKPPTPSQKPNPPSKKPPFPSPPSTTCSMDYRKLGSCTPLLGGILGIGTECCGLLKLDAVVCLCLAIDANILGIINIKVSKLDTIVTILTSCNCPVPKNLSCPS